MEKRKTIKKLTFDAERKELTLDLTETGPLNGYGVEDAAHEEKVIKQVWKAEAIPKIIKDLEDQEKQWAENLTIAEGEVKKEERLSSRRLAQAGEFQSKHKKDIEMLQRVTTKQRLDLEIEQLNKKLEDSKKALEKYSDITKENEEASNKFKDLYLKRIEDLKLHKQHEENKLRVEQADKALKEVRKDLKEVRDAIGTAEI